jgi:hypothetical protein
VPKSGQNCFFNLFPTFSVYLTLAEFSLLMAFHTFSVFWVSESLVEILNPIYTILQDSLEQKIIHVESDLSSFVEKEVITCLLSNVLLY